MGGVLSARRRCTSNSATAAPVTTPVSEEQRLDHRGLHSRFERSATIRTSTPGSARTSRSASGLGEPAQARGAAPACRSARRSSRARARRARDLRRRRRPPRRAPARRAATRAGAAPRAARARPPRLVPGSARSARRASAPSRCAERHARRTTRCDVGCGVTSASSRSPTAPARCDSIRRSSRDDEGVAHQPLRLDVLGDLAQRDLAQRLEVLDPEEAVERGRHARGRVDLAGPQPLDQRRRREVDEHDLVGVPRARSPGTSRARARRSARPPGR